MMHDGFEQPHDDNQDYDEVETIEQMAKGRALESEPDGRRLGRFGERDQHVPESIGSPEESDGELPAAGGEDVAVVASVSHATEPEEDDDGYTKTSDPVRTYMRKMGSISLLTREGEVELAKRIEEGESRVFQVVLNSTVAIEQILSLGDKLRAGDIRVKEVVKDADEDDPEFDESWHVERVCEAIKTVRRLHQAMRKVAEKKTTTETGRKKARNQIALTVKCVQLACSSE